MIVRVFGLSVVFTFISLAIAFAYKGWTGLALCAILAVLEVSLSFDNAVINATVLEKMSEFWQKMFLTVGILIAVFGMRLVFPLAIVWITAGLNPVDAFRLAMNPPPDGAETFPDGSPSYESILVSAHPQIAAFGGMFLLMLFLSFILSRQERTWLSWLERPLAALGRINQFAVSVAVVTLLCIAEFLAADAVRTTVLVAGMLGLVTYLLVDGLGSMFQQEQFAPDVEASEDSGTEPRSSGGVTGPSKAARATGKAGFFLFLYLEVLDASFSFDGVIGAFAITADPIIIALGLGLIGAMFVRSITIYLVRTGTLGEYRYLAHGAHWAIGALAVILLISIEFHIHELITGMIGIVFIGASLVSSVRANRRDSARTTTAAGIASA